jgi:DmsE family decaheme c-type cytochrome
MAVGLLLAGVTACQTSHAPERRTDPNLDPGWPKADNFFHQVSYNPVRGTLPTIQGAEFVNDDEICAQCHAGYAKAFADNVHRGDNCESCHGPASKHVETRGKEPGLIFSFKIADAATKSEACLKCHEENACTEGARYRTSRHAVCGVSCTDCHRAHYNVPPGTPATTDPNQTTQLGSPHHVALTSYAEPAKPAGPKDSTKGGTLPSLRGSSQHLGAVSPNVCYKCHGEYAEFQRVAGPHQICGPNGFNCTTCHDPHGQIREETRVDLCLQCHDMSSPTMAWHSSTHSHNGVACTDCHNPHPRTCVPQFVNISHTNVRRPNRLQMSVQDPDVCLKCHQKIVGLMSLPSHHPIKEGKMVCGDCHDAHGQREKNLRGETVNLLCYRCHAEKQGPFVYEHPPVTENCLICHDAHGTVANNLLRQPATFLCLRCHDGHRGSHGAGNRTNIDARPWLQRAFYTDCTQCHDNIHGTDQRGTAITNDFNRF